MKSVSFILIATLLSLTMCSEKRENSAKPVDTPTTGEITIAADESLRPLVEAEVETFNGLYRRAKINVNYMSEAEAFEALMQDSARLIVVTRHLTAKEKDWFREKQISTTEVDVAVSAIALIVNKENPVTNISMEQLTSVIQGKYSSWADLGGRKKDGIEIVFDNPNSGMIRYLKDSLAKVDKLPANCYAVQNNQGVIDHVEKNKNSLGLIGLDWISDKDDSTATGFLKRVTVMGVSGDSTHFEPYQAYIAMKLYPLRRNVTVVNKASRTGLNAGFSRFFQSEQGQRIVLKAGLVPKTMPLRIVEFK
jgi:phosphate transport system substrate-binding protein